jgi:transcriptional regulator with XRE-family HTH domain
MRIGSLLTDDAVLAELGERIARTRLERNQTQRELADTAAVGVSTLRRLEGGEGATLSNLIRILRALDLMDALDRLVPEPAPSPVQQLKLAGRRRRRASGGRVRRPVRGDAGRWTWADEPQP